MQDPAARQRSLLVLGGARSGKSRYAQRLAEASGRLPVLIATAQAHDEEMAQRIARHAADRSPKWALVEEPAALAAALRREAREDRIVVVDCATLWLSNLLLQGDDLSAATEELAQNIGELAGPVIFVSNEVGLGIVPENAIARAFRDAQGWLNQALAESCDAVVLVSAGLPLRLKPANEPKLEF
ncbi:bifunctional adenosylcobinamide kinase/adenosylcobinamide-phosphate guanylyltransferase [Methylocapsa polymorpha]|uniref:Bifunctional adenosylcobalamin biosynthesis protein n=1 Tax=Methylocapsa polymorpha TaxID=3080828 RepID=A0ABZ0HVK7_9HYPH|nr:bifunctional adenosylcobinamide kinase/adenosylcobinamide-phosphate guanylyltransferase [Methylocapsa sp. RX1]